MCGILGSTGTENISPSLKQNAITLLERRGPDHTAQIQIDTKTWFAHTRLSIIDPSELGHQPYRFDCLTLSFNGLIYNHNELREILKTYGYNFHSSSDTEVLIKAWHLWGIDVLHKLEGFFAFSLYDSGKKEMYLCRDPLGKKPLYWRKWREGIVFSSRLDAVEMISQHEPVNKEALQWLFYLKYIPEPLTPVMNIFKLQSGHFLKFSNADIEIKKWSQISGLDTPVQKIKPDTPQNLRAIIERAVETRLMADVPICCLLSGGLDSSIVASLASQMRKLDTFTLSVESKQNRNQFNEAFLARQTAKVIGSHHHQIELDQKTALDGVDILFSKTLDEPIADPASLLNNYLFSKISPAFRVCLTGDGADEVFGGYRRHQGHLLSQLPFFQNSVSKNILSLLGNLLPDRRSSPPLEKLRLVRRYLKGAAFAEEDGHNWLTNDDILMTMFTNNFDHVSAFREATGSFMLSELGLDNLNTMLALELKSTIPAQMMTKIDRTSMNSAIEVRSPFLDKSVIETAFLFPGHKKVKLGKSKYILRSLFNDILPNHVYQSPKRGFDLPLTEWLSGPLLTHVKNAMDPDFHANIGLETATAHKWFADCMKRGSHAAANHLWTLMGIKIWLDDRST